MRYQREGTLLVEGVKHFIFAKLDPIGDEEIKEVDANNVGVIKVFSTSWQDELEEVEEGEQGW